MRAISPQICFKEVLLFISLFLFILSLETLLYNVILHLNFAILLKHLINSACSLVVTSKTIPRSWVMSKVSLLLSNKLKRSGLCHLGDHNYGCSIPAFKIHQAFHISHEIMWKNQPAGKSSSRVRSQDHYPTTYSTCLFTFPMLLNPLMMYSTFRSLLWHILLFRVPSLIYWFIFLT